MQRLHVAADVQRRRRAIALLDYRAVFRHAAQRPRAVARVNRRRVGVYVDDDDRRLAVLRDANDLAVARRVGAQLNVAGVAHHVDAAAGKRLAVRRHVNALRQRRRRRGRVFGVGQRLAEVDGVAQGTAQLAIGRRASGELKAAVEHGARLVEGVAGRRDRRDAAVKAREELWRHEHAVDHLGFGVNRRRRDAPTVPVKTGALVRLRDVTVKDRRVRAVGGRPEAEALIRMDAPGEAVAWPESLVSKWPGRVVRVEGVVEERELRERADAQAAAFAFDQQLEIDDALFDERHRAIQPLDALAARLQLVGDRVGLDLPVARVQRVEVLDALAVVRRVVVVGGVGNLNVFDRDLRHVGRVIREDFFLIHGGLGGDDEVLRVQRGLTGRDVRRARQRADDELVIAQQAVQIVDAGLRSVEAAGQVLEVLGDRFVGKRCEGDGQAEHD